MPSTTASKLTVEQQNEILWKAIKQQDFWVYIFAEDNHEHKEVFQAFECDKGDASVGDCKTTIRARTKDELIERIGVWLVHHRLIGGET